MTVGMAMFYLYPQVRSPCGMQGSLCNRFASSVWAMTEPRKDLNALCTPQTHRFLHCFGTCVADSQIALIDQTTNQQTNCMTGVWCSGVHPVCLHARGRPRGRGCRLPAPAGRAPLTRRQRHVGAGGGGHLLGPRHRSQVLGGAHALAAGAWHCMGGAVLHWLSCGHGGAAGAESAAARHSGMHWRRLHCMTPPRGRGQPQERWRPGRPGWWRHAC